MALIPVRPKGKTDGEILTVDDSWLERWPEDFDRVPEEEVAAIAARDAQAALAALRSAGTEQEAPAEADQPPAAQPPAEQPARGRF